MALNKDVMKTHLHESKCVVTFEKVNGELRTMLCTLKSEYIPTEITENDTKRTKVENPDILPVYDLESNGWRSFRLNSVKEFSLA